MPQNFWNNPTVEPKRNFRFLLEISNFPDASWLVKTADRPKANVSSTEHKYINHTFNYPGRLVWNPISITLIDPTEPADTTKQSALLKASSVGALGTVSISALSFAAGPILPNHKADSWELKNAFIEGEINFGSFDYSSEDLLTVTFSLKYDWANLVAHGNSGG